MDSALLLQQAARLQQMELERIENVRHPQISARPRLWPTRGDRPSSPIDPGG
jgi:hypothetical protein